MILGEFPMITLVVHLGTAKRVNLRHLLVSFQTVVIGSVSQAISCLRVSPPVGAIREKSTASTIVGRVRTCFRLFLIATSLCLEICDLTSSLQHTALTVRLPKTTTVLLLIDRLTATQGCPFYS